MGGTREHESRSGLSRVGNVLFGADQQIAAWAASKIPDYVPTTDARSLGVFKDGKIAAAVVFERWNGVHVEAVIAAVQGSRWADRETLHALFFYPFVTLGCRAISVSVPRSNLQSLNLATKLGFEVEALIKYAAHDGSPLIILKMFRENCKWVKDHGKKGRRRTTTS